MVARPTDRKPSAEALRIRELLVAHLCKMIRSQDFTQSEAAKWLGVSQPRVSDLKRRRLDRFTIDPLIGLLTNAGIRVSVEFSELKRSPNRE
jgi:predicted XRE-type DNA-binding protein